jgi:hypothetical protein
MARAAHLREELEKISADENLIKDLEIVSCFAWILKNYIKSLAPKKLHL